ncbi:pas fold [Lucifera butyrica]|uniref:histidine kinase n=1 Tax=Lucifera butyrica TaxID=1351585 RepID=A0A498R874_9FIRM|nr:ATP-binding protein [Lucifera butyrica]VBB06383.1 pas fold [Lucifera butyrica]
MFKQGIRTKLIVSFLLLILASLLPLGTYILWYFYQHNVESLKSNLLTQAEIARQLLQQQTAGPPNGINLDAKIKELGAQVPDLRLTIINENGVVLADSKENPAIMENHRHRPEVMQAYSGQIGSSIRYSTTLHENLLYVAIPMKQGMNRTGVIRAAATLTYMEAGFDQIRSVLLLAFLLTSLLSIFLSLRLAHNYTAPLETIIDTARQIAEGKLETRVHVRTGDEVELLGLTLNHLTSSLEDRVNEIVAEKHKLELVLEHMDNAVILLDRYGRVVNANKMGTDVFGIKEEMLGQHNLQVIGHSLLDKAVHEVMETRQSRTLELKTNIQGNKKVFHVFVSSITGQEDAVTGIVCVFHDITAPQAIHERQAEFIANASHELATPLTAIKGFTETLLDGVLKDPDLSVKFIRIIHAESDRMQRLVKDLLQLARLDSQEHRQHLILEPTEVKPLLEQVTQELSAEWRRKDLLVTIDAFSPSLAVIANSDSLKQVLVNLVDNSIKYTPAGGKISLVCYGDDNEGVIQVKDTGIGIPAKDLPLIFDRFYRVDRARTRSAGGTGLGLSIVKFIVESLGGKIGVQSTVDVGTVFTLRLPLAQTETS